MRVVLARGDTRCQCTVLAVVIHAALFPLEGVGLN